MKTRLEHRSFTFVELIAAITVLAICIVPASKYMTDSMTVRRGLERDRILVTLAIQTIEEQMALMNADFISAQQTGSFAAQGLPDYAYEVVRTDAPAQGGLPEQLMAITVRVWSDENGNVVRDATESVVELHTKMARSVGP